MTFELLTSKDFTSLTGKEQQQIIDFLNNTDEDNFCTIQITYDNIEQKYILYGCYENDLDFVTDYENSGGVWKYRRKWFYEDVIKSK